MVLDGKNARGASSMELFSPLPAGLKRYFCYPFSSLRSLHFIVGQLWMSIRLFPCTLIS